MVEKSSVGFNRGSCEEYDLKGESDRVQLTDLSLNKFVRFSSRFIISTAAIIKEQRGVVT
jgi:hypothetical protein